MKQVNLFQILWVFNSIVLEYCTTFFSYLKMQEKNLSKINFFSGFWQALIMCMFLKIMQRGFKKSRLAIKLQLFFSTNWKGFEKQWSHQDIQKELNQDWVKTSPFLILFDYFPTIFDEKMYRKAATSFSMITFSFDIMHRVLCNTLNQTFKCSFHKIANAMISLCIFWNWISTRSESKCS